MSLAIVYSKETNGANSVVDRPHVLGLSAMWAALGSQTLTAACSHDFLNTCP